MAMVIDFFDPAQYAGVKLPVREASHLPPWCYDSPEFYRREIERVFSKAWNFVGRADHIPDPGDYFTVDLAGMLVIVMRDRERRLRGFANTCRHRGSRLLSGVGNCPGHISCPYHSWTYGLDGRLERAPGMGGIEGFELDDYNLPPVRLESWGGFVFICFDDEAESLDSYLGELPEKLRCYDFANMVCTRRKSHATASNWKLITENAMEDYHTATVHRSSIGKQRIVIEGGAGNWIGGHYETDKSIATLPGEKAAFPWISSLTEKAARGTYFILIYPSTVFACNQDGMFWLELYPRAVDRSELVVGHAFPRSTVERPDFDDVVQRYYDRADLSIGEDVDISEIQQIGLASPLSRSGRVSLHEEIVHCFANWMLDRVLGEAA